MLRTMVMYVKLIGDRYPTLDFSSEEAHARIYRWLGSARGSLVNGVDYSTSSLKPSERKPLIILSGRMLRELSQAQRDGTLPRCSISFPNRATISGGRFSTQRTSVSPRTESVYLSSVLEKKVPKKYFLSRGSIDSIIKRGGQTTSTFGAGYSKHQDPIIRQLVQGRQGQRIYGTEGLSIAISSQGGGQGAKTGLYAMTRRKGIKETEVAPTVSGGGHSGGNHRDTLFIIASSPRCHQQHAEINTEGISNSITSVQKDNLVVHSLYPRTGNPKQGGTGHLQKSDGTAYAVDTGNAQAVQLGRIDDVRRLTPLETERLFGWADNWTKYGMDEKGIKVEISDTQRYRMCGNGVVSSVVRELVSLLDIGAMEEERA